MGQSEANDIALVREARKGAGPDVDILVDAGQVWDWKTGLKRAEQFAEYGIFWLEEPLHPEDVAGYAHLCERSPVPIATGEAESRYQDFERLLVHGRIDWVQPDPGRCGLSTMVEVGRLAHRLHRKVVNHSFQKRHHHRRLPARSCGSPPRRGLRILHGRLTLAPRPDARKIHSRRWLRSRAGGTGVGVTINEEIVEKYLVN